MGLGEAIRSAVEAARVASESIQDVVQHEVWLRQSATGEARYADPVGYKALVQEGSKQHETANGSIVSTRARISFFPDADTRIPPAISVRDRITLPSGLTGFIVDVREGLSDPETKTQLIRNAWLG